MLERENCMGKCTIRNLVDYFIGCYMSIFKHIMIAPWSIYNGQLFKNRVYYGDMAYKVKWTVDVFAHG